MPNIVRVLRFVLFLFGAVIRVRADGGCRGTLKFQSAFARGLFPDESSSTWFAVGPFQNPSSASSSPPSFYSIRSASNAIDCANLCYEDVTFFCNSAIYEPLAISDSSVDPSGGGSGGGLCKLSQRALPCLSTEDEPHHHRTKRQERSSSDSSSLSARDLVLFCFRCLEIEDKFESSEVATMGTIQPPSVEMTGVDNEPTRPPPSTVDSTSPSSGESEPVIQVQETKEFESLGEDSNFFALTAKFKMIPLRMMTFNTWIGGANVNNGVQKIAHQIVSSGADIVAVQETSGLIADQVLQALGTSWRRCRPSYGDSDYILTRFRIVEEYQPSTRLWNTGCRLQVTDHQSPPKYINVWGVHLDWRDYGPYTVCFRQAPPSSSNLDHALQANEHKRIESTAANLGRMNNMLGLMQHEPFVRNMQQSDQGTPLIVAGDFNTPSHLDWTDQMRLLHCNHSYEWPVSKLMMDSSFKDSYRQVYPNPGVSTGFTWTPLHKLSPDDPTGHRVEPQDRIDFIYYRGRYVRAKASRIYKGINDQMRLFPSHRDNEWPSDHAAVITDFDILLV